MSVLGGNPLLIAGDDAYQISRSVRYRASASPYFTRPFATPTNSSKWTMSMWIKRGILSSATTPALFGKTISAAANFYLAFDPADTITWTFSNTQYMTTSRVFRDPSAWYHIVAVWDSANATAALRARLFVNGSEVTSFSTDNRSAITTSMDAWNTTSTAYMHGIGCASATSSTVTQFFDGHMTEINFIDGQALTPTSFGQFNSVTGVWQPLKYTGTYGTNGFYLPFSDNSTVESLGKDYANGGTELITNGMFVSNVTGWSLGSGVGGSPSITWQSAHTARISNSANNGVFYYQTISTTVGQTYYVQGYVSNISIGGSTREARIIKADDAAYATNFVTIGVVPQSSGSGWIRGTFTATATTTYIFMLADIIGTGTQGADFSFMSVTTGAYKNSWNPFNISLTAGSSYDSMIDTPTPYADGGNGRGNYSVLNPLDRNGTYGSVTDGNLTQSVSTANHAVVFNSMAMPSGKTYLEVTSGTTTSATPLLIAFGLATQSASRTGYGNTNTWSIKCLDVRTLWNGASSSSNFGGAFTSGTTLQLAYDSATGYMWIGDGTNWYNSTGGTTGSPSAGTNPSFTISTTESLFFFMDCYAGSGTVTAYANFGQRPFTYTPPSGFVALNTQNLPDSTIKAGNKYMDVVLQTGNTTGRTVSGMAFQPDLVWVKNRAGSANRRWGLIDSVRGVNKTLCSNLTDAEVTSQTDLLTAFNSDGFTIGADAGLYGWNGYVESWAHFAWKKGATPGFDIVTYTGNGSARTVAHSLGVAPKMMIVKNRNSGAGYNWRVYHGSLASAANYLEINTTAASQSDTTVWNNTAPTSSVFSLGTSANVNANADTYVAYLFSEVAGFSRMGGYSSNASSDGPMVWLGFRPKFVMIKKASGSVNANTGWYMFDSTRGTINIAGPSLRSDLSDAESTYSGIDLLSNGFKIRIVDIGTNSAAAGDTYIYAAFAENPFKNALAR